MAEQKRESSPDVRRAAEANREGGQGQRGALQQHRQQPGERHELSTMASPLAFTRRFLEDVDELFGEFFGTGQLAPRFEGFEQGLWSPRIEVFQRDSELVVRAELPGVKKEDVHVELNEDALTIEGRREQHKEERRGRVYHSERSYGSFHRVVPLPEGVIGESAKATFKDGILEIDMQAPPASRSRRGRTIDIAGGSTEASPETNKTK